MDGTSTRIGPSQDRPGSVHRQISFNAQSCIRNWRIWFKAVAAIVYVAVLTIFLPWWIAKMVFQLVLQFCSHSSKSFSSMTPMNSFFPWNPQKHLWPCLSHGRMTAVGMETLKRMHSISVSMFALGMLPTSKRHGTLSATVLCSTATLTCKFPTFFGTDSRRRFTADAGVPSCGDFPYDDATD